MNNQVMGIFRNQQLSKQPLGYVSPNQFIDDDYNYQPSYGTTSSPKQDNSNIAVAMDIETISYKELDWYKKLSPESKLEIIEFFERGKGMPNLGFQANIARSIARVEELEQLKATLIKRDAAKKNTVVNQPQTVTPNVQITPLPVQLPVVQQVQQVQQKSTSPVVEQQWIKGLSNTQTTLIGVGVLAVVTTVVVVAVK